MSERLTQVRNFLDQHLGSYKMQPLAGDASFRRYIRVTCNDASYMLMDAPPEKEDIRPFMTVCQHLRDAGWSAPHMHANDEALGFLLLEDMGDDTFSRLLRADASREEEYYTAAVELLADWHSGKLPGAELAAYDTELLLREIQLFSNWFLPQFMGGDLLIEAQASYVPLWQKLIDEAPLLNDQLVHRDYHADNLMWLPAREGGKRIGLLDFQDAVMGDAAYDLVSLLEDARRDVPAALAEKLLARYIEKSGADKERSLHAYALLAAQRNSKIVGIFTRLAARDGKEHYLEYLPRVWRHLEKDAEHPKLAALKAWLDHYVPKDRRGVIAITMNADALGLAA